MSGNLRIRAGIVLFCIALALVVLAPTVFRENIPSWWKKTFEPIHLGLDLQGGIHLVLGVDTDKAVESQMGAIADEFGREGIEIKNTTDYLPQILLPEGLLCGEEPTEKQMSDVCLGVKLALVSGGHDIGQSVVIKDQAVVCVEAMEGTDRCIRRAGEFTENAVVVKMAKPKQDLRFDVPCLGPTTIESMVAAKAKVLAAEAGKTFLLEPQKTLEAAMRNGITILGVKGSLGEKT